MAKEGNKLKAVVAGWKWGSNHMRAFAESEVCDLAALWSRTENPGAGRVAALFNVPLYTDFERMLGETNPDIASIATPESAHETLTVAALKGGAHVYCEKVLAPSRDAGQRMVECAVEQSRLLNVGYNYRYSPSCIYLAEAIGAGKIGKPARTIAVIGKEPLPDRPHASSPALLFPTFIYCALTMKTYMVQYESGAMLLAGATDYSSSLNPGTTLLVEGSEGSLRLDDLSGSVTLCSDSREALVYTPSQIRDSIGLRENCVSAVKDFVLAVHEDRPAPISAEDGVSMIELEEAIYRSAETGAWEDVE